jgi:uncharacterized membrane protein
MVQPDDLCVVEREQGISKARIGGLIDGVYAISMTLLVVTLELPNVHGNLTGETPLTVLRGLLPDILHYTAAFLILAGFWYLHHQRFSIIRWVNRRILAINLLSLFFITLVPFTTNIAGNYPADPFGTIPFSMNILVIGLLSLWEWYHIRHNSCILEPGADREVMRFEGDAVLVIPAISVIAIIIAAFGIPYSVGVYFCIIPIIAWIYWREVTGRMPG